MTCGAAVSTCASQAQWQGALHLLEMPEVEEQHSVITLTKAISACARSLRWELALAVGQGQGQQGQKGEDPLAGQPDLLLYTTWMNALERGAEHGAAWRQAVLLLDGLVQGGLDPDPLIWSVFVKICEDAGQPALSFLTQMDSQDGDDGMLILTVKAMGRLTGHPFQSSQKAFAYFWLVCLHDPILSPEERRVAAGPSAT